MKQRNLTESLGGGLRSVPGRVWSAAEDLGKLQPWRDHRFARGSGTGLAADQLNIGANPASPCPLARVATAVIGWEPTA